MLFDAGLRGELGELGDYLKNWNWESGFRYSRNYQQLLLGGVASKSGLREALLDTNPATAFNPFLGFFGRNSPAAISRVYVTLHSSGVFELPLGYFTINGDLFSLPAGPVSFALGLEYRGSDGGAIPLRKIPPLTRSVPRISKPHRLTATFGRPIRKCGFR